MDNDLGVNPETRCSCCSVAQTVLKFGLNEYCFDCFMDKTDATQPGWEFTLVLRPAGYDYEDDGDIDSYVRPHADSEL